MLSKVITISQQKGGTGKTTLAVHLAMGFVKYHNYKVAVVDTDPQGSLGKWFMIRSEKKIPNDNLTFKTASLWGAQYESKTLKKDHDVVIIDTAGRLHNKVNLMNELSKISRVMQKLKHEAPHEILLVLDGSTGQNAYEQAKQFSEVTKVTSMMVTKLDGTAKGGVVIGISDQLNIPIKYIGTGESIDDIELFDKVDFVESFFQNKSK